MSSGRPARQFPGAVDGFGDGFSPARAVIMFGDATSARRPISSVVVTGRSPHMAAAYVGGVGPSTRSRVDSSSEELSGPPTTTAPPGANSAGRGKQFRVLRIAGHRDLDGSAHGGLLRPRASVHPSVQPGQDGRRVANVALPRRHSVRRGRGNQVLPAAAPRRSVEAPDGVAPSSGSAGRPSAARRHRAVEPAALALRSANGRERRRAGRCRAKPRSVGPVS